jgi:long-chain fatty acid transport protein
MRFLNSSLIISSISALFFTNTAFAAAFQTYELGTPIIGTAAVGQAAVANDASTSYFNPAGMTALPTSQFMLGSEMILPYNHFSIGSANTISGNNGGNAGTFSPGLGMYYVYSYSPKLKLGISLTSPYFGNLNYNNGWVGRYNVQQTFLYTLNLNPSIAYEITRWLSLGIGVSVEYANLSQTVALPVSSTEDGQASIKVDNVAPGFNVGAMVTPAQRTRIGIAYRSKITHDLEGDTTFLKLSTMPSTSTKMVMPQNVMISLLQSVSDKFNLLGEVGWSNWSSMQNSDLIVDGYSATTVLDWRDTYRVGLGGQYKIFPSLMLQTGVSYDSSPTTPSLRTPDLPMDRQIRVGLGVIYSIIPAIQLGFSYEYINFGDADIDNSSSNGVLQGSYSRNYANVAQVSINIAC